MRTGDVGVEPFDTVNKPIVQKELEGSIGHWWLGPQSLLLQSVENLVGTHCAVALEKNSQGASSHGGEAEAIFLAVLICLRQRIDHALSVVVLRKRYRSGYFFLFHPNVPQPRA